MAPPAAPPPLYRLIARASDPVVRHVFRLHVRGLEHVPREGGFVLAANHLSNFDPWPLALALYPRQLHFMAKAELYTPVLKQVLDACGAFPVRRGDPSGSAFRAAVALAREGGAVAMFPEGTRRAKGLRKKHRPKPHVGAARIALAAGVPLVPAAVAGTDKLSRFGPIRVVFGPPFQLSANGSRRRAGAAATVELLARIAELERAL